MPGLAVDQPMGEIQENLATPVFCTLHWMSSLLCCWVLVCCYLLGTKKRCHAAQVFGKAQGVLCECTMVLGLFPSFQAMPCASELNNHPTMCISPLCPPLHIWLVVCYFPLSLLERFVHFCALSCTIAYVCDTVCLTHSQNIYCAF